MAEHITHYTTYDGGVWIEKILKIPDEKFLKQIPRQVKDSGRDYSVSFSVPRLHSFQTNRGRVWDVYNGWRVLK